jgi:hypothetical protein
MVSGTSPRYLGRVLTNNIRSAEKELGLVVASERCVSATLLLGQCINLGRKLLQEWDGQVEWCLGGTGGATERARQQR